MKTICAILAVFSLLAAPPSRRNAVLELHSPNGKFVVIFSDPAVAVPDGKMDAPWRKLQIRHPDGHIVEVQNVREDKSAAAIFPYDGGAKDLWSPDGNYMVVIQAAEITKAGLTSHFSYQFLDLEKGDAVVFAGEGIFATTDNFLGWAPTKPHTILMIDLDRKIEADPEKP